MYAVWGFEYDGRALLRLRGIYGLCNRCRSVFSITPPPSLAIAWPETKDPRRIDYWVLQLVDDGNDGYHDFAENDRPSVPIMLYIFRA